MHYFEVVDAFYVEPNPANEVLVSKYGISLSHAFILVFPGHVKNVYTMNRFNTASHIDCQNILTIILLPVFEQAC